MLEPEFVEFAELLADAARNIIKPLFRTQIAVDAKQDQSPVTLADRNAETAMRELIMQKYPHHGILGEEFGEYQANAEYIWVLDPVDGTKSFMSGIPTFGTLISLLKNGKPILGIIDQAINNERWLGGKELSSSLNGKTIATRPCPTLELATISTTSPYLFSEQDQAKFADISRQARYTIYGHDCYAYAMLASGFIDVVIESGLKPHDFCALEPIITNAGGIMTDWQGNKLDIKSNGNVIACGDKHLHKYLLDLLK